jgi:hypothetical protein
MDRIGGILQQSCHHAERLVDNGCLSRGQEYGIAETLTVQNA